MQDMQDMNDTKKQADAQDSRDYSAEERYDRRRAKITALLKWLECEFFGLFIFLSLMATTSSLIASENFFAFIRIPLFQSNIASSSRGYGSAGQKCFFLKAP